LSDEILLNDWLSSFLFTLAIARRWDLVQHEKLQSQLYGRWLCNNKHNKGINVLILHAHLQKHEDAGMDLNKPNEEDPELLQ
jgi:hypothetical protein